MVLKINEKQFEGKTEKECIYNAWNEYEKLCEFMSGYLTEYDKCDEDGEYIPAEYTGEQLEEAFYRATGNNPDIFTVSWEEEN